MPLLHYLAYGSNLHPFQLAGRVPSAQPIGVVTMPRKRLVFHKKSQDGSGKCMFYDTGDARDVMYGVVYQFDLTEKDRLDQLEGKGYNEQFVSFPLNGETYGPYVYVAASTHIDPSLVPYDWYKDMVLLGAHKAAMRLTQLNAATQIEDLKSPPSNRLEALKGNRKGQWSIRINDQWRVCFRFSKGDAFDVEIVDYH